MKRKSKEALKRTWNKLLKMREKLKLKSKLSSKRRKKLVGLDLMILKMREVLRNQLMEKKSIHQSMPW